MPLYLILAWVSLISSATEASASAAVFHCKVGLLCTLRLQESHSTGAEVVNEIVLSSSPCENLLAVTTELLGITAIRGDNGGQFRLGEPRSTGRFELCWCGGFGKNGCGSSAGKLIVTNEPRRLQGTPMSHEGEGEGEGIIKMPHEHQTGPPVPLTFEGSEGHHYLPSVYHPFEHEHMIGPPLPFEGSEQELQGMPPAPHYHFEGEQELQGMLPPPAPHHFNPPAAPVFEYEAEVSLSFHTIFLETEGESEKWRQLLEGEGESEVNSTTPTAALHDTPVTAAMVFAGVYEDIVGNDSEAFAENFTTAVAMALSVDESRINVSSIQNSSVMVIFTIAAANSSNEAPAWTLVHELESQIANPSSSFRTGSFGVLAATASIQAGSFPYGNAITACVAGMACNIHLSGINLNNNDTVIVSSTPCHSVTPIAQSLFKNASFASPLIGTNGTSYQLGLPHFGGSYKVCWRLRIC